MTFLDSPTLQQKFFKCKGKETLTLTGKASEPVFVFGHQVCSLCFLKDSVHFSSASEVTTGNCSSHRKGNHNRALLSLLNICCYGDSISLLKTAQKAKKEELIRCWCSQHALVHTVAVTADSPAKTDLPNSPLSFIQKKHWFYSIRRMSSDSKAMAVHFTSKLGDKTWNFKN